VINAALLCLLGFILSFSAAPAYAVQEVPLLYSRDQVIVWRKSLREDPSLLPWQKKDAQERNKLSFKVEVRDGRTLYNQRDWFNLSSYEEKSGVLLMFPGPTQSPIIPSRQYSPVDILFIDQQGTIVQIVPSILLSELQQEIMPESPVLAFLFLKAGICEKLVIAPGDEVEYEAFKKPPTVLSAPVKPQSGNTPATSAAPASLPPPKATPKVQIIGSEPSNRPKAPISEEQKMLKNLYGQPESR